MMMLPCRVLHITDIHLDLTYTLGNEAQCDLPMCCGNTSGEQGHVVTCTRVVTRGSHCSEHVVTRDSGAQAWPSHRRRRPGTGATTTATSRPGPTDG